MTRSSARSRKRGTGASRALLPALAALLVGCASRSPLPPPFFPLSPADATRAVAELASAAAGVQRYQGVLGVRGEGRRGRFSGRLVVVFDQGDQTISRRSPARLRLEAYGPVGGARWILVARRSPSEDPGSGSGEAVRVVSAANRVYAEGTTLARFTEELLGIPLAMDDIAAVVVGTGVPIPEGPVRPDPNGMAMVLPGGARIWWGLDDGGRPGVARARKGEYEVRYPNPARSGAGTVPRLVEVTAETIEARLAVEELQVNAALHPDSFAVRISSGYRRLTAAEFGASVLTFRR